jgi:Flp pilus assembly protein TadG
MMNRAKKQHLIRNERGQTATEFAIVLPVLALLLFGVIQFGILFNNYLTLTDAVRMGARKAAVSRQAPSPVSAAETAVRNSAADLDQARLVVTITPAAPWARASDVTVKAEYPYKVDLLGMVLASGNLKSVTTERVE